MATITCPECESNIEVGDDDDVGDIIECEDCKSEYELTGLNPPQIQELEEEDDEDEDF